MESKRIEKWETWLALKQLIVKKGYTLWQTQYDWNEPDGYIVRFMKDGKRLKIVTHNEAIEEDIIHSGL